MHSEPLLVGFDASDDTTVNVDAVLPPAVGSANSPDRTPSPTTTYGTSSTRKLPFTTAIGSTPLMPQSPPIFDNGGLQSEISFQRFRVDLSPANLLRPHSPRSPRTPRSLSPRGHARLHSIGDVTHSRRGSHAAGGGGLISFRRHDWRMISLSLRLGALIILFFWFLWDCIVDTRLRPSNNNFWIDAVLPVYRASGFLLMSYWMWGINVWVWRTYHINYLFLFELHPRTSDTHRKIFSNCVTLSIIFLVNFLLYFKMERGDFPLWFPPGIWPMSMFFLLLFLMCPWPHCGTPLKEWPRAFLDVLMAPFRPVKFLHVFIGDVLTSLVKPLIDVAYSFCFLGSGLWLKDELNNDNGRICLDSFALKQVLNPILSALPLWLRLLQCLRRYYDTRERFPHMVNAGKYATAQSVVLVGVFHASLSTGSSFDRAAWILTLTASTMYSYTWDVLMDWNLGKKNYGRLRSELIYPNRYFYYIAIILDLFFRFAWALTFVPATDESPLGSWYVHSLTPVAAGIEVLRRGVWSLIRVENEHLTQLSCPTHQVLQESEHVENMMPHQLLTQPVQEEEQEEEEAIQQQQQGTKNGWILFGEIGLLVAIVVAVALASYFTN